MGNYIYTIGRIWSGIDSLREARAYMRQIIKKDRETASLNRDHFGRYYIVRTDIRTSRKRIFYL